MAGNQCTAIVLMSLLVAVSKSLLCRELKRDPHNLEDIILHPSNSSTTVHCPDNEACATVWFQFGREVFPFRQGCWSDVINRKKLKTECRSRICSTVVINTSKSGPFYCPIGPLAVCCCNSSMCNIRVEPYNSTCVQPKLTTFSNAKTLQTSNKKLKEIILIVITVLMILVCISVAIVAMNMKSTWRCCTCPRMPLTPSANGNKHLEEEIVTS